MGGPIIARATSRADRAALALFLLVILSAALPAARFPGAASAAWASTSGPTAWTSTSGAAPSQIIALHAVVNGQDVSVAGDAIVQNGVVMVPYQGLFAPMGIRAAWNARERVLTLQSAAGDEMLLRPDDPYAVVNGERRPVPIPLVAVLDRILVPAQWIFETLGGIAAYDPGTRTLRVMAQITGVSWRATDAGLQISLEGTAPLHARFGTLHAPERVVVDVSGAVPKSPQPVTEVHEGPLAAIRMSQSAAGARIVFDLTGPAGYRVLTAGADRRIVIALSTGPLPPGPPSGYTPSAQKLLDVRYEHLDGGGRVVITSTLPLAPTPRVLRSPDRIVLDVADAVFIPRKQTVDVDDGLVVQVRAAQFHKDPNIVRVVVELARPAPFLVHPGAEAGQTVVELGAAALAGPGGAPGIGSRGPVVIAIDPGHGGSDPGAIGPTGLAEKDVVLAIARDLRALLARARIDTVMVRDADVFVPLEDRARVAARGGATIFVSIHANAAVDPNASGTQTFYLTPQSAPLAAGVLDEISRATGLAPRGAAVARFKVLVDNDRIPAILVETAFITNPREEQLLRDPASQQAFAQGIHRGLTRFLAMPPLPPQ